MTKHLMFLLLAFLGCLLPMTTKAAPASAKPILMMGSGYSHHEREALRRDVLEPNELTFEDGGEWTSAELWPNYAFVIVTHGFPDLNERELGWIRDYLNTGGHLLLTGPVLSSLRTLKTMDRDWLGALSCGTLREGPYAVTEAGKAFVPDAAAAEAIFGRGPNYTGVKTTTAEALVTRNGDPVLFRNAYGKGEVWFAGLEYFRILTTERQAAAKIKIGAPARQLLGKILLQGGAQKKSEQAAGGLKAYGAAAPVVWQRDFANARGAAFAEPPFPARGEELKKIHLDLGMNEWESAPFYISSARADADFSVTVSDLLPAEGNTAGQPEGGLRHKLSAADIRLRVQGVAAPALTVGPFWLLDVPRQDGAGQSRFAVPLRANVATTAWLTLCTHGVAPGVYKGAISFSNAATPPVPFEIRVWPVALPDHHYFEGEATSQWASLLVPPGSKAAAFGPQLNLPLYRKHLEDIADHGITMSEDTSWTSPWGRSLSLKNVTVAGTSLGLEEAIAQHKIDENNLPALDFRYFDALLDPAIEAGLTQFKFAFKNLPTDWLAYAKDIAGDDKLTPDSPRHEKIKRWLLGECVRYLHQKGIREITCPIADEIRPDHVESVLRRAKLLQDAGITVGLTTTGEIGQNRDLISKINPAIDRWIWNMTIIPQAKAFVRAEPNLIDKADRQYTYVADWHRAPYVANRALGPFCAYWDLDGLFLHGYLRWYPNGGAVFSTPQGPIDTEGWEGARDGIEDARYYKKLQLLLGAATRNPAFKKDTDLIHARLAAWVSKDEAADIHLEDRSYAKSKFLAPVTTYEKLNALKAELLDSLQILERDLPTKPTLRYGFLVLWQPGAPTARVISGSPYAAAALNAALAARGLPPLGLANEATAPTILIGNAQNNPLIAAALKSGELKIPVQPAAGSYGIFPLAKGIVIYAPDDEGALKGARNFGQLINVSEAT